MILKKRVWYKKLGEVSNLNRVVRKISEEVAFELRPE